jgi:calcium/calmodulin-dependent protein kinase I
LNSDLWAIGVITYFLLSGYTPFDRETNLEEMQAIIDADYTYTPTEYWNAVSQTARDFIDRCLTVDPHACHTAHQALQHPWIRESAEAKEKERETQQPRETAGRTDLLPTVRKNFNARVKLHAAIDTIRAINQLRAGQGAAARLMDGARSGEPARVDPKIAANAVPGPEAMEGVEGTGQLGNADQMEVDEKR